MEARNAKQAAGPASGLEGVVVAETVLSHVDGEKGELVLGGFSVEELSGSRTFEEVCALLWEGKGRLPDAAAVDQLKSGLGEGRVAAFQRLSALGDALDRPDGMDALRASLAHLTPPSGTAGRLAMVAAVPVFAAAWSRRVQGLMPVAPDGSLGHAEDYLRMVRGEPVTPAQAHALDAYLTAVMDHGMNASTFAARVVASTGSDTVSAIVAAVGALKGPLHGGAPGPVLDMLDGVEKAQSPRQWLEAELSAGRRIMGMGHRIYRVRDPRAAVLERAIERLEREGGGTARLRTARAVEREAVALLAAKHPDRPLRANVEFYTAVLLEAVGLPRTLFSPTFAVGRVAGWVAHVEEQRATGRLIRPSSRYVGPMPRSDMR